MEMPLKKDQRYLGYIQWETMAMAMRNLEKFLLEKDKRPNIYYRIQAERILADPASKTILLSMANDDQKTIKEFADGSGMDNTEHKPKKDAWYKFWAQADSAVQNQKA